MKNKAASDLGKLARGVPKTLSAAERARRRQQMKKINAARAQAAENSPKRKGNRKKNAYEKPNRKSASI